jgi:hypothetical protein
MTINPINWSAEAWQLFFMRRATKVALLIAACDAVFAVFFLCYLLNSVAFVPELVG